MDIAAFQFDAYQSGAFQSEVLAEAAFQQCVFQASAFQADLCTTPEPPTPVLPQEIGTGGIGRLPQRVTHVALIEFDFSFAFDADFERDTIDDDILAAIMLLVAEAV